MKKVAFLALASSLALTGCAPDISPDSYSVGSVGAVNRTIAGTVISARSVDIRGTAGAGGTVGAATGGVVGSGLGHGTRANIVGAIGGAVVGGIAGAAVESSATKQKGMEYVIQTENGNLMTIVQGSTPPFVAGNKVLVLYGSPSRIIADPRSM